VLEALYLNGAVNLTIGLAKRWRESGATLVVRKRLSEGEEVPLPEGVHANYLTRESRSARISLPATVVRMARIARSADVVIVSGEIGLAPIVGYLGARIARKPFVIAVHADLDAALNEWMTPFLHPLLRFVHRHANGVIVVEQALSDSVERNGLSPDRVRVVTNGIDVDAIRELARQPDVFAEIPGPRVVLTGRLAHQKATDVMLRAHAEVVRQHPHTVLVMNDGPDLDALRALAVQLGVTDTVKFLGRTSPHPTVAHADLFCLPSRHEGLPLALLEAMALGVPCIAADSSAGVREALDNGRAGELVPVDDVSALAAALRAHLIDPEPLRAKALIATARLARFNQSAMADGWAEAAADFAAPARSMNRARTQALRSETD
jgi:glycosyltransferase involved in cell wall biosynthesis